MILFCCLLFRFCEYLLACQSNEVRSAFIKILVYVAHYSIQDGPCPPPNLNAPGKNLPDIRKVHGKVVESLTPTVAPSIGSQPELTTVKPGEGW